MSEKEEFEKLPKAMPKWIKDHVELYLSDPDKARMSDSTIGGGPGPLPTLLLIARGAKSGKLRQRRAAMNERAAGRRWRRCIHPTTTTRSESVRGRFRWWFSSRSARYERFFLHPPETMLTNFYFGT
jgi:hypothetical protein